MDTSVFVAFIGMFSAVMIAVFGPWLMKRQDNNARAAEKVIDRTREDEVARKADERADKSEKNSQEAARLLKINTEATAATNAEMIGNQKAIHTLVNSDRTASIKDQLDAREIALALLIEITDLRKSPPISQQPTIETLATIEQMRASIAELRANLTDRLKQQAVAEAEAKKAATVIVSLKSV